MSKLEVPKFEGLPKPLNWLESTLLNGAFRSLNGAAWRTYNQFKILSYAHFMYDYDDDNIYIARVVHNKDTNQKSFQWFVLKRDTVIKFSYPLSKEACEYELEEVDKMYDRNDKENEKCQTILEDKDQCILPLPILQTKEVTKEELKKQYPELENREEKGQVSFL